MRHEALVGVVLLVLAAGVSAAIVSGNEGISTGYLSNSYRDQSLETVFRGQTGEGCAELELEAETAAEAEIAPRCHTADQDQDGHISLAELLRVVQFFNFFGFSCGEGTEDGYAPGPGARDCSPHDSDYSPQDWRISLAELLRTIQFFNSWGYRAADGTEDGFGPIVPPFSIASVSPESPIRGGVEVSVYVRTAWALSGPVEGSFIAGALPIGQGASVLPGDSGLYKFVYVAPMDAECSVGLALRGATVDGEEAYWFIPDVLAVDSRPPVASIESVLSGNTIRFTIRYEGAWRINLDNSFLDLTIGPDICWTRQPISSDGPTIFSFLLTDLVGIGPVTCRLLPGSSEDRAGNTDEGAGPTEPILLAAPDNQGPVVSMESVLFEDTIRFTIRYEDAWRITLDKSFLDLDMGPGITGTWEQRAQGGPTTFRFWLIDLAGTGAVSCRLLPGSSEDCLGNLDEGAGPTPPIMIDIHPMIVSLSADTSFFVPGQDLTVRMDFGTQPYGTLTALCAKIDLPSGWTFVSVSGPDVPALYPNPGCTTPIQLCWISQPDLPACFHFTVHVPPGFAEPMAQLTAQAMYRTSGNEHRSLLAEIVLLNGET